MRQLSILFFVSASGCYSEEPKCHDPSCDQPVVLDDDPGAPTDDVDGDGATNVDDSDDDGDGIDDAADVDVDGDGLLEQQPPDQVVEAARAIVEAHCTFAFLCCAAVDLLIGPLSSDEATAECRRGTFPPLVAELAQAAVSAGAAIDFDAWEAEGRELGAPPMGDECPIVEKGQFVRVSTIEETMLPYFHGVRAVGDSCQTRWDCVAEARCDGLVGGREPGTCGPRPRVGGPCTDRQPRCPPGATCSVSQEGSSCVRPIEENEFCHVFELDGRRTDDCDAADWCDDTIETPACRPSLHEADACGDGRQCLSLECNAGDGICTPPPESSQRIHDAFASSCEGSFPTYSEGS